MTKKLITFSILIILMALYVYTAATFVSTKRLTGDEPHYLIISQSVIKDLDFEVDDNYLEDRFNTKIYGDVKWHAFRYENGWFSIHNIGFPLFIALPFKYSGKLGVRIFMALVCGLLPFMIFSIIRHTRWSTSPYIMALFASSFSLALPYLLANSQVYPGFLVGLFALWSIYIIGKLYSTDEWNAVEVGVWVFSASFMPWLHVKNTAVFVIALFFYIFRLSVVYKKHTRRQNIYFAGLLLIPVLSLVLLGYYNYFAFQNIMGPYEKSGIVLDLGKNIMIFLKLHFDQSSGMFLQHPFLFLGLISLIPLALKQRFTMLLYLLFYCALIIPNCLHPNWQLFPGFLSSRFNWGASMLWAYPVFHSLILIGDAYMRLGKKLKGRRVKKNYVRKKNMIIGSICLLSIVYQMFLMQSWIRENYIEVIWDKNINFLFHRFPGFFPSFMNFDTYWQRTANIIVVLAAIILVGIGWVITKNRRRKITEEIR